MLRDGTVSTATVTALAIAIGGLSEGFELLVYVSAPLAIVGAFVLVASALRGSP
jgi:hypothetical protein